MLSQKEIKDLGLIHNAIDKSYTGPSYNLRIAEINPFDINGPGLEDYILQPRGQVLVTTKEVFEMPDDVVGYTTVKNSLSLQGVYALNIGIVDPGYKGPISTILINFGNKPRRIFSDSTVLRMTFHRYQVDAEDQPLQPFEYDSLEAYSQARRGLAGNSLGDTFLSIKEIKSEVTDHVKSQLWKSIGVLTVIVITLGVISICVTLTMYFVK